MEDIKAESSVSATKANSLAKNGRLFTNNEIKGSINSWRFRAGSGHVPGFFAMSEARVVEPQHHDKYCQCKEAIMDAVTHCCTVCNEYFDALENKSLESYRVTGV
jgi:hypothetical protein